MKKIILEVLLIFMLFAAANNIFFSFIKMPYSWGSYYSAEKCLEENSNQFNTVLLGSSIAGRQVNPFLFDSLTKKTRTLNMGMDGMKISEVYYQFNHLVDRKPESLKYILIDLCEVDILRYSDLHTIRKKYYYTYQSYFNAVSVLIQSPYPFKEKLWQITLHTINFIECALKFNELDNMLRFKRAELNARYNCNVYSPLVINAIDTAVIEFEGAKQRSPHIEFLKHVELLERCKNEASRLLNSSPDNFHSVNTAYLKMVNEMITKGKEHSVQVIFVLPPKMSEEEYKNVLPVYHLLNSENKISLADPAKYPEFYELKYAYDLAHLDREGSRIYTTKLAEQFLQRSM